MEVKKAIKKVIALGAGATMVGATIMGAMAADLSDYPSPFVKDGKFDAIIVVGDTAAASDVIGSVDIATSLQFSMKKTGGTGTGVSTSVEGDAWLIEESGNNMNFNETSPVDVAEDEDLKALAGGSITNDKGTYTYDQYITVAPYMKVMFEEDNDQSDDPAIYLKFPDGYGAYVYRMSFPTAFKSDIDSSDDFEDFDNKKITMLGSEYTFVNTDNNTGKLTLMSGAIEDTMQEGETRTFTLNDKDFEVEIVIVTDSAPFRTKMKINGEVTDELQSGDTYTMNDKTEIGIRSILANEAGDVTGDMVEFYLGAKKVVFEDSDWTSTTTTGTLTIGSDSVNDVVLDIVGTQGTSEGSISKIEVAWNVSEDMYVPIGGKLSDQLESDEKDQLFLERIDYEFAAQDCGNSEEVILKPSGSNKYKLEFYTKSDNKELSFDAFHRNESNNSIIVLGESETKPLIVTQGENVSDEWYFVVEHSKYSHLLQVKSFNVADTEVKFKNVAEGTTFEVTAAEATSTAFYLDGYEYKIKPFYTDKKVQLDLITDDGDGIADLWTKKESRIVMNTTAVGVGKFYLFEAPDLNRDDSSTSKDNLYADLTYSVANSKMAVGDPASTSTFFDLQSLDSVDDKQQAWTKYGTFVEYDTSGDQSEIKFTLPGKECEHKVYLSSGVTKVSTGTSGDTVTEIVKINVGAAQLASAVEGEETKHNLILVGGPCANKAAAVIMGNPEDCTEGFEPGKAMIKMYENDGKVAMLVAGFSADDTRRAAKVIATYDEYSLSGSEVSVSGTSMSDITVTKVTTE